MSLADSTSSDEDQKVEIKLHDSDEEDSDEENLRKAQQALYPGSPLTPWFIVPVSILSLTVLLSIILGGALGFGEGESKTSGSMGALLGAVLSVSLVPGVVIIAVIWFIDRNATTFGSVGKFYSIGGLFVIPIIIAEGLLSLPWILSLKNAMSIIEGNLTNPFEFGIATVVGFIYYFSFIVASLSEETAKFISCLFLKRHLPSIQNPYTIVILMMSCAIGFASVENYGYILSSAMTGDITSTLIQVGLRAVLSVPLHAITGGLIGCSVADSYFKDGITFKLYFVSIYIPILIHGTFDIFAMAGSLGGIYQFLYIGNVLLLVCSLALLYKRIQTVRSFSPLQPKSNYQMSVL